MKIYEKFLILDRLLSEPIPLIKSEKEILIKVATEADVKMMRKEIGRLRVNQFLKRMKENKVCIIALIKDKIVYYRWISFERKNLVPLQDKEAYLFDAYTLPEYRRLGIHTAGSAECLRIAKEKGYERVIVSVSFWNYPAQKTLRRLGFKEAGRVTLIKIPCFKWHCKWIEYNRC